MSEYVTGLVFRQLALFLFPDSLDFECCLKSKLENPELNTVSMAMNLSELVAFGLNDKKKLSEI